MASPPEAPPVSDQHRDTRQSYFPNPRQLVAVLACYFSLQVVLRLAFSDSVDLDEAEAVVLAQKLGSGYGSAPPLYTWLQIGFFHVFGTSILALSLLKNLLLFSTYLLTFATARLITGNPAAGVAAALSVFYLPSLAWESQRDLTHSVLAVTLSLVSLFVFLKLHQTRRLRWYLGFGLCAGFGLIAKYNYALWLLGLVLAGFSLKEFRPALLNPRLLLSAALALLIFLPNGLWMLEHRELALLTSSKFEFKTSLSWLAATGKGLKGILQSVLAFAAPLGAIYCLLFFSRPKSKFREPARKPAALRLILLAWVFIGFVLLLFVICVHATAFKERWFQPILIALPILAVTLVGNRLDAVRLKRITSLSLIVMCCVAVVLPGRLLVAERLNREETLTRPYATIAAQLQPVLPPGSLLICDTRLLAGNLRLGLPGVTSITPDLSVLFPELASHCFLVWDARHDDTIPPRLREWLTRRAADAEPSQPQYLTATYKYHRSKPFRVALTQVY